MTYEKEPGILRESVTKGDFNYARVRSTHTGEELWRCRSTVCSYADESPVGEFNSMEDYIVALPR